MNRKDFLNIISEKTDTPNLQENDELEDIAEYDSLAMMEIAALFNNKLNTSITFADLKNCKKVSDILDLGNDFYEK